MLCVQSEKKEFSLAKQRGENKVDNIVHANLVEKSVPTVHINIYLVVDSFLW